MAKWRWNLKCERVRWRPSCVAKVDLSTSLWPHWNRWFEKGFFFCLMFDIWSFWGTRHIRPCTKFRSPTTPTTQTVMGHARAKVRFMMFPLLTSVVPFRIWTKIAPSFDAEIFCEHNPSATLGRLQWEGNEEYNLSFMKWIVSKLDISLSDILNKMQFIVSSFICLPKSKHKMH